MDHANFRFVRIASDRHVRTQENGSYTPQQIHSVFLQHPSASEQIPRWPKTAARNDSRGDFIYLSGSVMLLFCFNRHCHPEPAKRAKDLFCRSKVNKTILIVWRITEKQSVPCVPAAVGALFLFAVTTTILASRASWHARHG